MDLKEQDLQIQVSESDSNISIKSEIEKQLQINNNIIKSVKNNPELKEKFSKEFDNLRNEIKKSLIDDNKITKEELSTFRDSMIYIVNNAKNDGIDLSDNINIEKLILGNPYVFGNTVTLLNDNKINSIIGYLKNNSEGRDKFLKIQNETFNEIGLCPLNQNHTKILTEMRKIDYSQKEPLLEKKFFQHFENKLNGNKKLTGKLFNAFLNDLNENPCYFNLLDKFNSIIEEYNKTPNLGQEQKINLINEEEIIEGINIVVQLKQAQVGIKSSETNLELINGNISNEVINNIYENFNDNLINEKLSIVGDYITSNDIDLINKLSKGGKDNKEIMLELRKQNKKIDEKLKEYEELKEKIQNITIGINDDIDTGKNLDSDIPKYLDNPEQIYSINDEKFLIKVLKESEKLQKNEITLVNINPTLRNNINIISELKIQNFDYMELSLLSDNFFKNFDNLSFIINKVLDKKVIFLKMQQIYKEKDLLITISKLIKLNNGLINSIPISILKMDNENIIGLNDEFGDLKDKKDKLEKFENANDNKENIIKTIENLLNPNRVDIGRNIYGASKMANLESYDFPLDGGDEINMTEFLLSNINEYIEYYGIEEIKEEIKLLIEKGYLDRLYSLPIYFEKDNDLAVYAIKSNINNINYIPQSLRSDEKIISTLIDSKDFEYDKHLEYIEFSDIHSVIHFYKLLSHKEIQDGKTSKEKYESKIMQILLNKKIRFKINEIIKNIDIASLFLEGKINQEENIILGELSNIMLDSNERSEEINKISNKINQDKRFKDKYRDVLEKAGISLIQSKKIVNLLEMGGTPTKDIFGIILDELKDKDKAKNVILELEKINLEKIEEKLKEEIIIDLKEAEKNLLLQTLTKKGKDGNDILDNSKLNKHFLEFLQKNPKKENEKISDYEQRIFNEYLEILNLKQEEHKKVEEKILLMLKKEKITYNIEHIDTYVEYLSGTITKEEFEKQVYDNITKSGKEILEKSSSKNITNGDSYSFETSDYTKTELGYIIKSPVDGTEIIISKEEKDLTLGNPEATENLINFYMFFKKLNLLGVWKYRKELMISVGDIYINPNDGDSIKGEELRKFGNKLLTFISNIENEGKGEKVNLNSINSVNQELRKFGGANSMLSDGKTFNLRGEDKFTAYLRSQGIIGGAYFKTNKFRENIA